MIQRTIPFPPAEEANPATAHDLLKIFSRLNSQFFENSVTASISWGRNGAPKKRRAPRRRHMTLGSYCRRKRMIRIHPALNREGVPPFFVEAIVFHEMCHEIAGEEQVGNRRLVHTRHFRELERRYPMFAKAREWGKINAKYILSARRP